MAENKDNAENSSSGSVTLKTMMRKLSLRKKKEKEVATPDGPNSNTKPRSPDTQKSPTTEDGSSWISRKISFNRKSVSEIFKSIPESSTIMEKETITKCNDTHNIPPSPLSVMEINKLIETEALETAYCNILSLEKEVECEKEALGKEGSSVKLAHKEKDLNLLYNYLKDKLSKIVHQSCDQPSYKKELLVQVVHIFQNKEKRGGDEWKEWRDVWRIAVKQGVKETLGNIPPKSCEQNDSCIGVHLELLGKKIVELLEMVKAEIQNLYPPKFQVFETYAISCHEFVSDHLKVLLGQVTELKDYNALLDFAINQYHSGMILSSPSLQPEMKELKFFTLSDDLLGQIKKSYFDCLQENLPASIGNIINTEKENIWKKKVTPKREKDEIFLTSEVYTDICDLIRKYSDSSAKIDGNLEKMAVCKCMEALKHFPKRFEVEFSEHSRTLLESDLLDSCLWAEYHVAYINSFSSLKEHIEGYREKCSKQVQELITEVDGFIGHLRQALLKQFRAEIELYLGRLMTKDWLNTDTDFNELVNRIETYSGYSTSMRQLPAQTFANDVHYLVMKGYISELLRNKYSCKGKKNEDAAAKINEQCNVLNKLFCEMGSTLDWLHSLGFYISEIIKQEHEKDIKNVLNPLVENYPDISKKQFSAILSFRDNGLRFERSPAIQCFIELKRKLENNKTENLGNHVFFSDIQ
ncbi:exocyst complex component 3-like protein 4 isoform 2-T5 [Clarias gariepinus]|nr:tumor necrosis factor alpha-induced protein 2 isoform X2 [Clarias gariepinus]XP_053357211.1 tumor necrosis factor alpha-induced protein 2 isoform X2 [Clarias gariepinus]XP_053357212.1 tumor necrosis factor alpha-induced protein 2 isoform X2 [Clarias gariepinus]